MKAMLTAAVTAGLFLFTTGCRTTTMACADTQAIVDTTAAAHPGLVRLSVHRVPAGASECCAVASTAADKRGQKSDPEDVQAMETGQTVVLDEGDATDVTVPVMMRDGEPQAVVGVTLRNDAAASRDALVAMATEIARSVESALAAKKM